ncbi:MAG: SoxR reducing system RseC family protein [Spirochaetia bacterium]|jgi:positive regulator of sigma E activity
MQTQGKITAIEDNIVTIEITDQEICTQCGIKTDSQFSIGCNSCSLLAQKNKKFLKAINNLTTPLKEGDMVNVSLSPAKAIKAGFFIFIIPLVLFFLFYYFTEYVLLLTNEWVKIGMGLGGILLGFMGVYFRSKLLKQKEWPQVTEVVR